MIAWRAQGRTGAVTAWRTRVKAKSRGPLVVEAGRLSAAGKGRQSADEHGWEARIGRMGRTRLRPPSAHHPWRTVRHRRGRPPPRTRNPSGRPAARPRNSGRPAACPQILSGRFAARLQAPPHRSTACPPVPPDQLAVEPRILSDRPAARLQAPSGQPVARTRPVAQARPVTRILPAARARTLTGRPRRQRRARCGCSPGTVASRCPGARPRRAVAPRHRRLPGRDGPQAPEGPRQGLSRGWWR